VLHLYAAGAARPLAQRLAALLVEEPPFDPMASEWLAVPSDGMRRWLRLELARHLGNSGPARADGVAANLVPAYPGTLRASVLAAGRDDPDDDPWRIDRMVWAVLSVLERSSTGAGLNGLVALPPGASLFGRARRVADLFDRYHLHRPEMIRSWAEGELVDGRGESIERHTAWQANLWRAVRDEIGEPSPPERLPGLLEGVRDGSLLLDLPDRLLLFGFTLLPGEGFLPLVGAVAARRDVHLFLLQPSAPGARRTPAAGVDAGHPLLRSWGRPAREAASLVAEAGDLPPVEWVGGGGAPPPDTLLARLQEAIRTDSSPRPGPVSGNDRSVRFHSCFGPMRQVQVARDALLHLLARPGTDLCEEDILVLCPALDRFAPLIDAEFGGSTSGWGAAGHGSGRHPPALRYRLADQSIRTTNPMLGALAALLELVEGRFEVPAVLDVLALGPVRERFRFDDDHLATVARWVAATEVRWGMDADQRARFGMPRSVVSNTWRAALDRLLLGAAVHDDDRHLAVGGVAPFGVDAGDLELLGRLCEALGHLADMAASVADPRPVGEWLTFLREVTVTLLAAPRGAEWQREGVQRALAEVAASAATRGVQSPVALEFRDVRRLVDELLDGRVGRPDFFRGGVTVTSMTPLRWVPFRVICVLGMDQTAFGSPAAAADDLIAAAPRPGDRDPRAEARQALLEAVLAAGDHLVVVRDGTDVHTNQPVPRAVVAAELFDAVVALAEPGERTRVADALEIHHPRHSYDEPCFVDGALGEEGPWGFDRSDLDGALARRGAAEPRPFLAHRLRLPPSDTVGLADLHAFFRNPSAVFVATALETRLPRREERLSTLLPVAPTDLEKWKVGDRMLSARLGGMDLPEWLALERARSTLPPGLLEQVLVEELDGRVTELLAEARARGVVHGSPDQLDVDTVLADGTRLVGAVPLRLPPDAPGAALVRYGRVRDRHILDAWLDLMALAASAPGEGWRSLVIGTGAPRRKSAVEVVELTPAVSGSTGGDPPAGSRPMDPRTALGVAVDCYRRGMREPVPLFPILSRGAHMSAPRPGDWISGRGGDGEDPAVSVVFPGLDLRALMELPARPGDPPGPGGRVTRFAHYLWGAFDRSVDSAPGPPT
jgi:exodeoxyribonuclease V gamma subunit